ncbi:MAG TPA: hypothetical protein VJQ43_05975, partial [Thermoplasmata archaeon]|nr:hypothetical protein [Thermoplasmata archaeon]
VAWYRWGSEARFRDLHDALLRLVDAAHRRGVPIVHVSVPPAPDRLERRLPYLTYKRRVDDAVRSGGGPYSIVRPTLMFGAGDVLLGVMLRAIRTYGFFPMFGDGSYRISPVSSHDVARLVGRLLEGPSRSTLDLGGPGAFRYRDVTDRMFALLGRRPRYWSLSARGSVRLARLMQSLRSGKLYAYEVEWLLSDTLALPRSPRMDWPMERVEPYLRSEVSRLTGESAPDLGPLPERG